MKKIYINPGHSISTHTPLAGRDSADCIDERIQRISTHTPLAGRDRLIALGKTEGLDFYSHAPCGARPCSQYARAHSEHFYSHAPCGARRMDTTCWSRTMAFLLTRPLRGATFANLGEQPVLNISTHTPLAGRDDLDFYYLPVPGISTHTPLAGRDCSQSYCLGSLENFYSHAPCGARLTR